MVFRATSFLVCGRRGVSVGVRLLLLSLLGVGEVRREEVQGGACLPYNRSRLLLGRLFLGSLGDLLVVWLCGVGAFNGAQRVGDHYVYVCIRLLVGRYSKHVMCNSRVGCF